MNYLVATLLVVGIASAVCFLRVLVQLHLPLAAFVLSVFIFCIGGLEHEGFPLTKRLPEPYKVIAVDMYKGYCAAGDFVWRWVVVTIADDHSPQSE